MDSPPTSLDKLTAAFIALGDQAPILLTKIGILRSLINEIDAAKYAGCSYGLILEALIKNGFKQTTVNQFYGLMNRIRIERGFAHLANQSEQKIAPAAPVQDQLDGEEHVVPAATDVTANNSELKRPPGISNAEWSEMQVRHKKANRA